MSATAPKNPQMGKANSNIWSTRQLVTMALLAAIGALFSFIQIPLIPAAPFLTYDPSLVPAMIAGFAYGAGPGVAVGCIAAVIHGLILGEWVGTLMNILATLFFVLPAALIYRKKHTLSGAVIGLVVGIVCATLGAVVSNLTVGVWFWYGSVDAILPLLWIAVVPFNLAKAGLNAVFTMIVYKSISNLITPEKDQVKGRPNN